MDVPDRNMPYSPYFKIEKRDVVYVACGIYEDRIPEDGKIVIPDGVELDDTWDIAYDKSDKRLGILKSSKVKSISVPAGASSKTFSNIAGWALFVENHRYHIQGEPDGLVRARVFKRRTLSC